MVPEGTENQTRYRIVLSGRMLPGYDRDAVIEALIALFGSSREKMARLLQGTAIPFKKAYTREEALEIRDRIRAAGAECEVEPLSKGVGDRSDEGPRVDHVAPSAEESGRITPPVEEPTTSSAGDQMAALMAFVGPKADFYKIRFARFGEFRRPRFAPTWHWPAFFVFFLWALYRKLWLWAGLYLAGSFLLLFFFAPLPLLVAWLVVWPLIANWLYYLQARSKVLAVGTDPAVRNRLVVEGGVSGRAALFGIGFVLMLNFLFSQLFLNRLVRKFEQEYGELLPEGNSMLRGDGSLLDMTAATPQLKQSVQRMNLLAVSINLWLAAQKEKGPVPDLDRLKAAIAGEKFIDGWGNPLQLRQAAEGVMIRSAGPDGEFDSFDDILRTVPLNRLDSGAAIDKT